MPPSPEALPRQPPFAPHDLYRKARRLAGIALRTALHHSPLDFDRRHGVETWGTYGVGNLRRPVCDPDGHARYEPCSVRHFHFAMRKVPPPLQAWSFVDVGSGKGRAVLLALGYPFRRVVGVELDPRLHDVAARNVVRYRGPRACPSAELVCADATRTPLPPGDVVLFFYHPFEGPLLERFLDHLEASARAPKRRLLLVYSHPVHRAAVACRPAFRPVFDGLSPPDPLWRGVRALSVFAAGGDA